MTLRLQGTVDVGAMTVEIDIAVDRGETVALVGPNGAGKSTVLRAIAGLAPLSSGSLINDDTVWDDPVDGVLVPPQQRRVGFVFQQYRLFEHLDARENVAFGLRARGVDRSAARATAMATLERLGVGLVAGQHPSMLSGGQAQRVALARALVTEPSVLLLDEPLAALDVSARGAVRRDLQRLVGSVDAARILVTHDPVDAHTLADRVLVLEAGRVTQVGTVAELAAAPRSSYVADLVGTNLVRGDLRGGTLTVADGVSLAVGAHHLPHGPTIATVRPAAVALHRSRPEGTPRNVWRTEVVGVDVSEGRVRVRLGLPFEFVVEVTTAGFASLAVDVGDQVWASVKASEISVVADG